MAPYNGLGMSLGNLSRISKAETRSISPENPTGGKGQGATAEAEPRGPARDLGKGWKCRPSIPIKPGETETIAEIDGPGALQSMWIGGFVGRDFILRIYWEGQERPSVECPLNDFFASPWMRQPAHACAGPFWALNSLPVAVNPNRGLNCFWEMPFRKHCRMTLENIGTELHWSYYQINYTLTEVPEESGYFHAQFRRVNPVPYLQPYTILEGVTGEGHYVGTSLGVSVNNNGWWGEGEIKFYMDGDKEYPTICGTGTEDYFGGSYNWEVDGQYIPYTTPFLGMHTVIRPDGLYQSQYRHAMYRWHVMDPIRFSSDLKVTIDMLGWREGWRYYPGQHDVCSVAYWYQTLPAAPFPKLPDRDELEVI